MTISRLIISAVVVTALCSGCASLMLGYSEEPLCRKGVYGGYCASMTEVYDEVTKELKLNKKYRGPQVACDDPTTCN
jgi:hypothetical protein